MRLASKVTTGASQKKARPFEYASSEKEKKKKKRNPETKSNGHRWSVDRWSPVKAGCK